MIKDFNFEKLHKFNGSVLKDLRVPDNYRSYAATSRKIIKLYMRMHEEQVLYPELVNAVKEVAKLLKYLGTTTFKSKTPDNLIEYWDEIITFNLTRWLNLKHNMNLMEDAEVTIEESRERKEGTHCAFCRVQLHFPAYVLHRTTEAIVHRSLPLGIKCLRTQIGKLNTFLNAPQIVAAINAMQAQMVTVGV